MTLELVDSELNCLDEAGRLLHLCLHLRQDHIGQRSKKLHDLERAINRLPREAWAAAARLAHEVGAEDSMSVGLRQLPSGVHLASELDLPVPTRLELVLRSSGAPRSAVSLFQTLSLVAGFRPLRGWQGVPTTGVPALVGAVPGGDALGLLRAYAYRMRWVLVAA